MIPHRTVAPNLIPLRYMHSNRNSNSVPLCMLPYLTLPVIALTSRYIMHQVLFSGRVCLNIYSLQFFTIKIVRG